MEQMSYDVIIVGSGSAGGVLAERLTDSTNRQVLLVEAGVDFSTHLAGTDPTNPLDRRRSRRGNATQNSIDSGFTDWGYAHDDGLTVPYGKQLGGSSAHNGQQTFRGTRYDHAVYPAGWQYNDLAPYYAKVEQVMNVAPYPRINWDAGSTAFEQAALALGYPAIDNFNQAPNIRNGVGPTTTNIKGMTRAPFQVDKYDGRQSVLETFLEVARDRPNLTIRRAFAKQIVLEPAGAGHRARGIVLVDPVTQAEETIEADLIISCANVYGSPTLLMRSGIGPGMNIELPAVGQNYQNQPLALVTVVYDRNIHPQFGYPVPVTLNKDYDKLEKSVVLLAFNVADPIFAAGGPSWGTTFKQELAGWRRSQAIGVFPVHGSSRGTVTLDETKPNSAHISLPISTADQQLIQSGVDEALRIVEKINAVSKGVKVSAVIPGSNLSLASHGIGTCAMGSDPATSVVDTNLMVHGVERLMVCDGSVMPSQVQSPHLLISSIAYKIADTFIRKTVWGLPN
jgi:choline dehydrogenase